MSGHRKWADIRRSDGPESEARVEQYKRELWAAMSLAQLRQARSLTQAQLGSLLGMPQPTVSRLERQTDMYLSTLRSYVEAMGGALELRAVFPDGVVAIDHLGALGAPDVADDPIGSARDWDPDAS